MSDQTYKLLEVVGYVVQVFLLPGLFLVVHFLRGINKTMDEIHWSLISIQQWKDDHETRDNERFEGVHARVGRLEERVDGCQALLHLGRQQHP